MSLPRHYHNSLSKAFIIIRGKAPRIHYQVHMIFFHHTSHHLQYNQRPCHGLTTREPLHPVMGAGRLAIGCRHLVPTSLPSQLGKQGPYYSRREGPSHLLPSSYGFSSPLLLNDPAVT